MIVLAPDSVRIHQQTIRAFDLAEQFRVPVVVIFDEALGHLQETVDLSSAKKNKG